MRRRLFTLCSAGSLLLCVAMLGWWARSFLPADLHAGAADGRLVVVFSEPDLTQYWRRTRGGGRSDAEAPVRAADLWRAVARGRYLRPTAYAAPVRAGSPRVATNTPPQVFRFAGFVAASEPAGGASPYRLFAVPLLYPAALLAVPPGAWPPAAARCRRRARAGHCRQCGYDLRESPDRCPEYGTPAKVNP